MIGAVTSESLPPAAHAAHIGVLGGAFDPPHLGHQMLALSFLALEPIDALWVIPCHSHAIKGKLSNFAHRFAMCRAAFDRIREARVLDLEQRLPAPNYTFDTLCFINKIRPDLKITLAIGSDLIDGFDKWHCAEAMIAKFSLAIFERSSYPIVKIPELLSAANMHKTFSLPDIDSTKIRKSLQSHDLDGLRDCLDRKVLSHMELISS